MTPTSSDLDALAALHRMCEPAGVKESSESNKDDSSVYLSGGVMSGSFEMITERANEVAQDRSPQKDLLSQISGGDQCLDVEPTEDLGEEPIRFATTTIASE